MLHFNRAKGAYSYCLRLFIALALLFATVKSFALTYCDARGNNTYYEYIKGVTINGLVSNSAGQGYALFASPVFQLAQGANSVTLTPGFNSSSYREGWSVFVDLNQDGVFSTDERLLATTSTTAVNSSLTIPSGAKLGSTRLRVIMQYSNYLATACGSFYYGEVEDYTVNITSPATPPPPPPPPTPTPTPAPTKIATTTVAGFDRSYLKELVVVARYKKDGVLYSSSSFFSINTATVTRAITLDVDANTTIEWSAQTYLDSSPAGVLIPANCKNIVGDKCITTAGAFGETVIFKEQPPVTQPAPAADLTIDFNNLFGGATYKAGSTLSLAPGVSATTSGSGFYNQVGTPFNWGYFFFSDLTLDFVSPIKYLTFKATSSCFNCSNTVNVLADGLLVASFVTGNTITGINISLPNAASKISFSQGFYMDDLAVSYVTAPQPTTISTSTIVGYDTSYNANLVVEGKYIKNGVNYLSSTVYLANSFNTTSEVVLDADVGTKIYWTARVFLDNTSSGILVPLGCTEMLGNSCATNAGSSGEAVIFKRSDNSAPLVPLTSLTFNFDNLFGGATSRVGPSLDLGNGITATTTGTYFRNPTGSQFTSGYLSFTDLTLKFPSPVLSLSFKAAGSCTNCSQTVVVTADGQVIKNYTLNYSPATLITLTLPTPATKITFSDGFSIDDLTVNFK